MKIESGVDAIFLPGKIHGCEEELYIIYLNAEGNEGKGCMEIEIVDYETILDLYKDTEGDCARFFCIMPDYFHGKWKYEPYGTDGFDELCDAYEEADFIFGRDGDCEAEMRFIVDWAKQFKQRGKRDKSKYQYIVLQADNVSSDIEIAGVFNAKKDAIKCLNTELKDALSCYDKEDLDYVESDNEGYSIFLRNGDLFYAQVRKILKEK
jgi:hypothetical protein